MDLIVRRVLDRYAGGSEVGPSYNDKSWMEYIYDQTHPVINPENPVYEMMENVDELGDSFNTTNPYNYKGPSDKLKNQEDSPPFINNLDKPTQFGYFRRPKLWTNPSSLKEWWDVRREDWTRNEEEQRPALSITRKYSSIHHVLNHYVDDHYPLIVDSSELSDFIMISKVAANLYELREKDKQHYKSTIKRQRAQQCVAVWANKNNPKQYKAGLFRFRVSSPGSQYSYHTVYFQFLRGNQKSKSYLTYPVHIGCTCPSFLYWGAQYYAVRDKYMYMPMFRADYMAPKPRDVYTLGPTGKRNPGRGLNFRVCKHILAAMDIIGTLPIRQHYKKYPVTSPPSKEMNEEVWENLMGFKFDKDYIRRNLKSGRPKIPHYYDRENVTPAVNEWFQDVWIPRSDDQKIDAMEKFVEFPERIYFFLLKESYLKGRENKRISDKLIDVGFDLMSRTVQRGKPQIAPEIKEQMPQQVPQQGTGPISPNGDQSMAVPADDYIRGKESPEEIENMPIPQKKYPVIKPEEKKPPIPQQPLPPQQPEKGIEESDINK
jgi:hypothetical protein